MEMPNNETSMRNNMLTPKLFQIDIALTQHCHLSNIGVMGNELKIKITSCEIGAGSLSYLTWGIGLWPYGQIKIINNALLAKWLWECATERWHLWKQIVEMKYGLDAMGLVLFCRNQSYVWDVHVEEFQKQLGGIFWLSSLQGMVFVLVLAWLVVWGGSFENFVSKNFSILHWIEMKFWCFYGAFQ